MASTEDALLVEAIRLVEQAGPLDDAAAVRDAVSRPGTPVQLVARRARTLAHRLGLVDQLARARRWAPWMFLAVAAAMTLAGCGMAAAAIDGPERRINLMSALAGLLGLHLLTLTLWLIGFLLPTGRLPLAFGSLWLLLTARVAGGRRGQAPILLGATTRLLARARLLPWTVGGASHALWSLSFVAALAGLLFALAFRRYTLVWESTILEPGFFATLSQGLGWLPARLGFPVPDMPLPFTAGGAPLDPALPRSWALWLTGCVLVYGLLPRLGLLLLCGLVWRRRRAALLEPERGLPYHRALVARMEAAAPARVVDADPGPWQERPAADAMPDRLSPVELLVGYELPADWPWPPPPSTNRPVEPDHCLRIDGSAAQRRALLDHAARVRPRRMVLGVREAASPDRAFERLLRELLGHCGECRLWLMREPEAVCSEASDPAGMDGTRWHRWLQAERLPRTTVSQHATDEDAGSSPRQAA